MTSLILTGLDGANPLGFLAAVGLLAVAEEATPGARLSWRNEGRWRATLTASLDREALLAAAVADLRTWDDDPAIALSYPKAKGGKLARDIKPLPVRFRQHLGEQLARLPRGDLPGFLDRARRPLDYASVFATEIVEDNNGNTKPTALHFTAGQQEFLKAVLELVAEVTAADLEEAIFGPWTYQRELPVLGWDSSVARDYALRADDPSKSKKAGVPGADWLAFRGLALVPVAPVGGEIRTAGCAGGWKTGTFTWPLWSSPLGLDALRSLMTLADLQTTSAHARRARGIAVVLRAGIRRSDQGGYGSFQPAVVVAPGRAGRAEPGH